MAGGIDEDILSLDVAMHDARLVQRLDGEQHLGADKANRRLRKPATGRLPDVQREVATAAVVDCKVEVPPRLDGAMQLHDKGMLYRGEDVALGLCAAHHLLAVAARVDAALWLLAHGLECDRASRVVPRPAVVKRIRREVEDAHHPSLVKTPQGTTDRNRRGQDLHCNLPQVSMDTLAQYDACLATCEDLFKRKTLDYGTAWRILRPSSLTDQIFIKANRIRTIQQVGESKVDEGVESEFIGIVNYCFMAMVQCRLPEDAPMELAAEEANRLYDASKDETRALMQKKNHDYGEAWRDMRISSLTDLILMKVLRVKQIENNDGKTVASEGVEANYMDMANYALFALILSSEQGSN